MLNNVISAKKITILCQYPKNLIYGLIVTFLLSIKLSKSRKNYYLKENNKSSGPSDSIQRIATSSIKRIQLIFFIKFIIAKYLEFICFINHFSLLIYKFYLLLKLFLL